MIADESRYPAPTGDPATAARNLLAGLAASTIPDDDSGKARSAADLRTVCEAVLRREREEAIESLTAVDFTAEEIDEIGQCPALRGLPEVAQRRALAEYVLDYGSTPLMHAEYNEMVQAAAVAIFDRNGGAPALKARRAARSGGA